MSFCYASCATGLIFENVLINFSVCMRLSSPDKRQKLNGKLLYVHIRKGRLVEFSITIMSFSTPHSISSHTFLWLQLFTAVSVTLHAHECFDVGRNQIDFRMKFSSRISLFKNEKSYRSIHCQVLFDIRY